MNNRAAKIPYQFIEHRDTELWEMGVESIWYYRCDQVTPRERVIPDGKVDLIFHYGDPMMRSAGGESALNPSANLVGPMSKPYYIEPQGRSSMVGVRFHEAEAQNFFDFDLGSIKDQVIDLEEVWHPRLVARLLEQDEAHKKADILKGTLKKNYRPPKRDWLRSCVEQIRKDPGRMSVSRLSSEVGYTTRYLEKVFSRILGLTPGQFMAVNRLQQAIAYYNCHRVSFTQLSYRFGYADQSHFTREFKKYIHTTPSHFFRETHPMLDVTQQA